MRIMYYDLLTIYEQNIIYNFRDISNTKDNSISKIIDSTGHD